MITVSRGMLWDNSVAQWRTGSSTSRLNRGSFRTEVAMELMLPKSVRSIESMRSEHLEALQRSVRGCRTRTRCCLERCSKSLKMQLSERSAKIRPQAGHGSRRHLESTNTSQQIYAETFFYWPSCSTSWTSSACRQTGQLRPKLWFECQCGV